MTAPASRSHPISQRCAAPLNIQFQRLFDGVGDNLHGLDLVRTVAAPNVTHLKFTKR